MYLCISVNKNTSAIVVICNAHEGTIITLTASFYSHYCQWRSWAGLHTYIKRWILSILNTYVCMYALSTPMLNSKDWYEKNCYQIFRILMCYHRSVVLIKIYSLHHSESFPPLLLLFLFDWLTKRWKIAKEMSINRNSLYLLCHTNCQMYVNMIASSITTTYY